MWSDRVPPLLEPPHGVGAARDQAVTPRNPVHPLASPSEALRLVANLPSLAALRRRLRRHQRPYPPSPPIRLPP